MYMYTYCSLLQVCCCGSNSDIRSSSITLLQRSVMSRRLSQQLYLLCVCVCVCIFSFSELIPYLQYRYFLFSCSIISFSSSVASEVYGLLQVRNSYLCPHLNNGRCATTTDESSFFSPTTTHVGPCLYSRHHPLNSVIPSHIKSYIHKHRYIVLNKADNETHFEPH